MLHTSHLFSGNHCPLVILNLYSLAYSTVYTQQYNAFNSKPVSTL